MLTQMDKFLLDEQKLIENFVSDFIETNKQELRGKDSDDQYLQIYSPASKGLEIIVRPECTQNCEYCYIINHGKELYPLEERLPKEELIKNFKKIITYFNKKKIFFHRFELFAGDLFYDGLAYELLNMVYDYYSEIYNSETYYISKKKEITKFIATVGIPLNASLVEKEENFALCKEWIEKFDAISVGLNFSMSVDGKYATSAREKKSEKEVDAYYDKVFRFCKEMGAGIHPMISAASIEKACENYDWWYDQLHSDKLARYDTIYPMSFEVRNGNEWTEEKLKHYIKFLDHLVEKRLEYCNNSIEELTYHLFVGDGKNGTLKRNRETDPIRPIFHTEENSSDPRYDFSCSLSGLIHINLSNFALVPCHRLTYLQFVGGWMNLDENGELDGTIKPNSVSSYIALKMLNCNMLPKCNNCKINRFCMKGCLGAQYEYSGEVLMPIPSVCTLFEKKFTFLYKKYAEMGVIKECFNKKYLGEADEFSLKELLKHLEIEW